MLFSDYNSDALFLLLALHLLYLTRTEEVSHSVGALLLHKAEDSDWGVFRTAAVQFWIAIALDMKILMAETPISYGRDST
jgi:hypothetical protein